jgi:uncharacterized membrane protein YdjX (TVP38/TMEM64 family)
MNIKKISAILLIALIVVLCFWSIITVPTHDRQEIKSWATMDIIEEDEPKNKD